jgi:hypothetical protein
MMLVVAGAAAVVLVVAAMTRGRRAARWVVGALVAALVGLLVIPGAWALSETSNPVLNATLPQAGPRGGAAGRTFGSAGFDQTASDAQLAAWLKSQRQGERWDLVTASAMNGSSLEAQYGLSVMALGGFLGTDPATTPERFAEQVATGEVRYVLVGGGFGGGFGRFPRRGSPGGGGGGGGFPGAGGFPGGGGGGFPPGGGGGGFPGAGALPGGAGPFGRSAAQTVLGVAQQACPAVTSATAGAGFPAAYSGQILDCAGRADDLLVQSALNG